MYREKKAGSIKLRCSCLVACQDVSKRGLNHVISSFQDLAKTTRVMRRDLKLVLGPPRPVSFRRRARRPPVELDPRVGTEAQIEGTQETRRRAVARSIGPASADAPLIVPFVVVPTVASPIPQLTLEAV